MHRVALGENSILSSEEDRITEDSVELCQEGIEQVQSAQRELFEFWKERSVKEDLHRVTEHPAGSARSA
jgi:hypothetical protein